jgi:hypothetical protein
MDQQTLRTFLDYNPDTGIFTWAATRSSRAQKGAEAGTVNGMGYQQITINHKIYLAHRLAHLWMTGKWPKAQIDHINGDKLDNNWDNLRPVDNLTNARNQKENSHNTSGATGVRWEAGKWRVRIKTNNKLRHIGRFVSFDEAVTARKAAEKQHGFHPNHGRKSA